MKYMFTIFIPFVFLSGCTAQINGFRSCTNLKREEAFMCH